MKLLILGMILLFFVNSTASQADALPGDDGLDLGQCISLALQNNRELGVSQAELAKANADLRRARTSRFLPVFDLKEIVSAVPDARGDLLNPETSAEDFSELGPFTRLDLELLQPLYTFGRLSNLIKAASHGVAATEWKLKAKKNDLVSRVTTLYYGILVAQHSQKLLEEGETTLNDVERKLNDRIRKGDATLTDRYRLGVARAELAQRRNELDETHHLAIATLKTTLGLAPEQSLSIKPVAFNLTDFATPDLNKMEKTAMMHRPELKALESGVAAYQALWRSEKAAYLPQFFIGGGFRFAHAPDRTDIDNPFVRDDFNTLEGGAAIGFQLPLSFWQTGAKANQARAQLGVIEHQYLLAKDAVALEVTRGYEAYNRATSDVRAYQSMEKESRNWLNASLQGFSLGLAETKEVLEAYVSYMQARLKRLLAVMQYYRTKADLDRLVGGQKE